MANLPIPIVYNILDFNDTYHSKYVLLSKYFNKFFSKKKKFSKFVYKIMNWYKANTYMQEYETESNREWFDLPKKFVVKYYCKHYPKIHLMCYPEFMARKLHRDDLQEYINANMRPIDDRKKIEVINFLSLPSISNSDIAITGW